MSTHIVLLQSLFARSASVLAAFLIVFAQSLAGGSVERIPAALVGQAPTAQEIAGSYLITVTEDALIPSGLVRLELPPSRAAVVRIPLSAAEFRLCPGTYSVDAKGSDSIIKVEVVCPPGSYGPELALGYSLAVNRATMQALKNPRLVHIETRIDITINGTEHKGIRVEIAPHSP